MTGGADLFDPASGVLEVSAGDGAAFAVACSRASDPPGVRAMLVTIDGADAVAAGMAASLAAVPAPVIAALSGALADRALELALAADVRVCGNGATFSMTQVRRGELPSDGGTQRLPRLVGPGLALDMFLTGRLLTADGALAAGLVTEVVDDAGLAGRARALAGEVASRGAMAGRYTKEAVREGADMTLDQGVQLEADLAILLHTDPERAEGIDAFRSRRDPRFRGDAR